MEAKSTWLRGTIMIGLDPFSPATTFTYSVCVCRELVKSSQASLNRLGCDSAGYIYIYIYIYICA